MPASICHTNDLVNWVIRFVLLVYAAFVADRLPLRVAVLFDNTVVRLVLVALVLALGTCDPASAILLAVGLVLSIQSANKHHLSKIANHAVVVGRETFSAQTTPTEVHEDGNEDVVDHSHADETQKEIELEELKKAQDASSVREPESTQGNVEGFTIRAPFSSTCAQGSAPASSNTFISPEQLAAMQTNQVANNQDTEVRTWKQENGPQGLDSTVKGFSFREADAPAPFK